jgi:hypothetical protein
MRDDKKQNLVKREKRKRRKKSKIKFYNKKGMIISFLYCLDHF